MTDTIQKELARLRRYDEELTKLMPPDFKDWHQNSKEEYPEVAAWVITHLREELDWAHKEIEQLYEEVKESREQIEFAYEELERRG
jgi:hypothetical protein